MTGDGADLFGPNIEVLSREPVVGGVSDASKFRLQVLLTDNGQQVERTLLLKQTSQIEVAALAQRPVCPP